jgi:hypothetical protein
MEDKQPQSIVKFLLGESDFENKWYGVRENGIAPYWWRTELRKEVESFTSQLSSVLKSYNRECKRNDELQAEVDELLSALIKARKRIAVNAHEESMFELDSTITKYSALSKHQPIKKDETL